jgi:hypothetical protein
MALVFAVPITLVVAASQASQAWSAPQPQPEPRQPARTMRVGDPRQPLGSTVGSKADFNGDGFGDIAVGVSGENLGSISNAGGVNVIYGSSSGLASTNNQFWSQNSKGVIGIAETNDHFGYAVAAGDFNGDGFSDLAIGVPFESLGSISNAGGVNVLYGTSGGLSATNNQFWSRNSTGITKSAKAGDELGFAVVGRDFNGDGYTDLAVGAPHSSSKSLTDNGSLSVLYGGPNGLSAANNQYFHGVASGEEFGTALAAGAFMGDPAHRDLAVGAPGASNGQGLVYWLKSGSLGLKGPNATRNLVSQNGAHCGASLASGNFDNDANGFADVAAGCPNGAYPLSDDGSVEIHIGSAGGLGDASQSLTLTSDQTGAEFGSALAAANFGNDSSGGSDDLAVGAPLFDVQGNPDAGEIEVFYFGSNPSHQVFSQGSPGIFGDPEGGDILGAALTTGNFDNDGFADLAIGVPGESIGSVPGAGGINVLYGSGSGLTATGSQFWSQDSQGIVGVAESEDFFGNALSGRAG